MLEWIAFLGWPLIWGFVTSAVARNKGYGFEDTKWFWLGFFFSFLALIVIATKPQFQAPASSEQREIERHFAEKEREQMLLDNGGWKCICGRVNDHYVSSCSCGRSRIDCEYTVKPQIVKEEKSNAALIREYKELLDSGIITQQEFDAKKKQLLGL